MSIHQMVLFANCHHVIIGQQLEIKECQIKSYQNLII